MMLRIPAFFKGELTLSFILAICLHLAFFLLFKITFLETDDLRVLPPVKVEAEVPLFTADVPLLTTVHGLLSKPLEPFTATKPSLKTSQSDLFSLIAYQDITLEAPTFEQIEKELYFQEHEERPLTYQMTLQLSPGLHLLNAEKIKGLLKEVPIQQEAEFTYHVFLEGRTGKLFHRDHYMLDVILKEMQFEKSDLGIIEGLIHVTLTEGAHVISIEERYD